MAYELSQFSVITDSPRLQMNEFILLGLEENHVFQRTMEDYI